MALRDVPDFVPDDAREFTLVFGGDDEPRVHRNKAPGHGKGVEACVTQREKDETEGLRAAGRNKPPAEAV